MSIKQTAQKIAPSLYSRVKWAYWKMLIDWHRKMNLPEAEEELRHLYRERMGRELDLENPKRYTEKIQWCKLHATNELKSRLADKYAVRDWVAKKIGQKYLIPFLGVWKSPDEIDFNALPESFVLKTNHASGTNIIVPDKSKLDRKEACEKLRRWLGFDIGWVFFEVQYLPIKPLIIAEKFMENPDGSEINDYKFICFGGKARYIRVDCDRHGEKHTRMTFDTDWNVLPWVEGNYQRPEKLPERPNRLEELMMLVETLAEGFSCVRVDFYVIGGEFYFGEMTFSSGAGFERIYPDKYDEVLGDEWDLSQEPHVESFARGRLARDGED